MQEALQEILERNEHTLALPPAGGDYEMHFTRDNLLINKYKLLREELCNKDPRFTGFRGLANNYLDDCEDPDNHMLVIHKGNDVYGGASIRISTPKKPVMFYLEQDVPPPKGKFYFSLKDEFPEFNLDKYACAEFDEIVLHPNLRKGEYVRMVCQTMLEHCISHNVRYMFGTGDMVRLRLYSRIYRSLNLQTAIHKGIDIPLQQNDENVKRYVLYGDMKNFHVTPEDPDATCLLHPAEDYEFH